jgi:hypothetical protein
MAKVKEEYRWCELWRSSEKEKEKILKDSLEFFVRKYKENPEVFYCNKSISLKTYMGIPIITDKQLFHIGLVFMPVPRKEGNDEIGT